MQADTQICNLALQHLGQTDFLTNVCSEDSLAARLFQLNWTTVLREVLADYPWRFAIKRWNLGGPTDTYKPEFRWDYAFVVPEECLRVVKVYGPDGREMKENKVWEREGKCLCTNEPGPLFLKGVESKDDANEFSPKFVSALSFRLAAQIAPGVGEKKQQSTMMATYLDLINSAKSIDSTEAATPSKDVGGWVSANVG